MVKFTALDVFREDLGAYSASLKVLVNGEIPCYLF